jgi:tripartite-type tricarboxylate transporter receptor subunit TctC
MTMTDDIQPNDKRRMMLRGAGLSLGAMALGPLTIAQVGERAIKFILPVATASGVDTITAHCAQPALAKALGHPVVIENQPGAGASSARRRWFARRPMDSRSAWCRTIT